MHSHSTICCDDKSWLRPAFMVPFEHMMEYESQLIAKLYELNVRETNTAENLLEEIDELQSPVFLFPMYAAYKRFAETSISHYFISSIALIKTPDSVRILEEILGNGRPKDQEWALGKLIDMEVNTEAMREAAVKFLTDFSNRGTSADYELADWEIRDFVSYLKKVTDGGLITPLILPMWENNTFNRDVRIAALSSWLRLDSSAGFDYLIKVYPELLDASLKMIIAREIVTWKGSRVDKLKDLIKQDGSSAIKAVITADEVEREKKASVEQQRQENAHGNAPLISEISELRSRINSSSQVSIKIGTSIFRDEEALITQIKTANDKASLIQACASLRIVTGSVNDGVKLDLSIEEMQALLPGVQKEHINKGLNSLEVFAKSKGVQWPSDLYGLRKVHKIVSLFEHPEDEATLRKLLQAEGIENLYLEGKWSALHRALLEHYRDALKRMLENIESVTN